MVRSDDVLMMMFTPSAAAKHKLLSHTPRRHYFLRHTRQSSIRSVFGAYTSCSFLHRKGSHKSNILVGMQFGFVWYPSCQWFSGAIWMCTHVIKKQAARGRWRQFAHRALCNECYLLCAQQHITRRCVLWCCFDMHGDVHVKHRPAHENICFAVGIYYTWCIWPSWRQLCA